MIRRRRTLLGALAAALVVVTSAGAAPPDIDVDLSGTSGDNGWYRGPVTVSWTVTGATSSSGCDAATYSGDTSHETDDCTAENDDGSAYVEAVFKIDQTGPQTTGSAVERPADANGWYNRAVRVDFSGTDATSGIASCTSTTYNGPDSATAIVSGTCRDKAGNTGGSASASFRYDGSAPQVTAMTPDRPPDHDGWYNHPVTIAPTGSDGLSGLDVCVATPYGGPDGDVVTVSGTCRDKAGNTSAPGSLTIKYDATPPAFEQLAAAGGDRLVALAWAPPQDGRTIEVVRTKPVDGARKTLVYRGTGTAFQDKKLTNGVKYRYLVTSYDQAGNGTTLSVNVTPLPALFGPKPGAKVSTPPLLAWRAADGAPHYNVQLFRGEKKILSLWPRKPRLRLKRSWMFQGVRYRLEPGTYRWFVWPGREGSRRAYGKLLGQSRFVVVTSRSG